MYMRLYVSNAVENIAAGMSIVKRNLKEIHYAENGKNQDAISALMVIGLLERDLASLKRNIENAAES